MTATPERLRAGDNPERMLAVLKRLMAASPHYLEVARTEASDFLSALEAPLAPCGHERLHWNWRESESTEERGLLVWCADKVRCRKAWRMEHAEVAAILRAHLLRQKYAPDVEALVEELGRRVLGCDLPRGIGEPFGPVGDMVLHSRKDLARVIVKAWLSATGLAGAGEKEGA